MWSGACVVIFRTQCWNMLTIILVDADGALMTCPSWRRYYTWFARSFCNVGLLLSFICTFWLWWFELPLLMTIEEFARSGIKYLLLSRLVWFYDDWTHQLSMVSWMCALGFDVWLFFRPWICYASLWLPKISHYKSMFVRFLSVSEAFLVNGVSHSRLFISLSC